MKKIILILFVSLKVALHAQNAALPQVYKLYLNDYVNRDTIPDDAFENKMSIHLLKDGQGQNEVWLNSFDVVAYNHGKITTISSMVGSPDLLGTQLLAMKDQGTTKVVIENIIASVKNATGSEKRKMSPVTFYRAKTSFKKTSNVTSGPLTFEGKILTGDKNKVPLVNQMVTLKSAKTSETQSATTDKYGDFSFKNVDPSNTYNIEVSGNSNVKENVIFLAKPNGVVVRAFKKNGETFVYELLPAEITSLAKEKDEDTELAVNIFSTSKNKELTVIENIYYEENSSDIKSESFKKLDGIIGSMIKNPLLKLSINSYTDSKGDAASNMMLSQKRAQKVLDYFVSKGVSKERLNAQGYGETLILNRCIDGVDCSEKEHQLNRRTEFKFTK